MNADIFATGEVYQICRSCLVKGDNMISLHNPYNRVVSVNSNSLDLRETIGTMMMTCADIQV